MKKLLLAISIMGILFACSTNSDKSAKVEGNQETVKTQAETGDFLTFGTSITSENAMPAQDFLSSFNDDSTFVKLTGKVDAVCQKKGCWMNIDLDNGETMKVTFKDYGFFVPKDIAGKKVVIEGKALRKVTPVAELKHYAEDAGKSQEEIDAITEDKKQVVFEAEGVLVSKI